MRIGMCALGCDFRLSSKHFTWKKDKGITYGKENIRDVHDNQDGVSDTGQVNNVTESDQGTGNEVVNQHGHVILALHIGVEDIELLEPESKLDQVVGLEGARQLVVGVSDPVMVSV